MQLNQATLPMLDFDLSVQFYKRLGLKLIVSSPPRYARFECRPESGQGEPATFSLALGAGEAVQNAYPAVYFETSNVDKVVELMRDVGAPILSEPEDKSYGWREATVQDPAGNRIRIYWGGENRRFPPWRVADE